MTAIFTSVLHEIAHVHLLDKPSLTTASSQDLSLFANSVTQLVQHPLSTRYVVLDGHLTSLGFIFSSVKGLK